MLDCLQRASQDAHKTIAFPALGTGNLGYPKDVVAQTMIETAQQFHQNNPESPLEKVNIVVHNDDATIFEAFQRVKEKTDEEMKRRISFNTRRNNRVFDIDAMEGATRETTGSQPSQLARQVTLHVSSDDIRHVETASRLLDTFCKEAITTQCNSYDSLKTMNQRQQDKIRKLSLKHSISVDFDPMTGEVKLEGLKSDVMDAMVSVHTTCNDILLQKQRDEKAKLISSYVRWEYTHVSGTGAISHYDKFINQKIEKAYMAKKDFLYLPVIDGNEYVLDFKKMEEIDRNNQEDRVRVIRKDLTEGTIFETPSYWSPVDTECEMIELKKKTSEYRKVEEAFSNSVGRQITILKIKRIQAQWLWKLYVIKRQHLEKQQQQNPAAEVNTERVLWHGTSMDAIPCIAKNGFNRSYSGKNATAFGKGVYFAVSASVSDKDKYSEPDSQGHKHMFQARVLTGNYCKGRMK
ncbi:protein mono-ADP-ribosyltransferase PARP14-like isoform X2 [Haliotis rubra]|nr:protein mono-ADP-ribosyltransferase PARP14-like isoform X2 [Haliotis rubra]XP_046555592.1 protein mono-ADP-ribosyltransferase PARP14-like isoform X2 [Haliotis rubra]